MINNLFQKSYHKDLERVYKNFSKSGGEIILDNVIGDIPDIQKYFEELKDNIKDDTRILISYHNYSWESILIFASMLGLRKKTGIQNWITQDDLKNILNLSGFEVISHQKRFFGITAITTAKLRVPTDNRKLQHSVSIIVPARNEEGNIAKILPSIPKFGKSQEFIFVEGGSSDQTWEKIQKVIRDYRLKNTATNKQRVIKAYKQTGKGKADAVKLGFEKAKGDIIMIYDADMTVPAPDLPKFYDALVNGIGEFANGSRLVYPMEGQAMQFLNKLGNQFFSHVFTKIFGQRFKDTLCGTKALWRHGYLKMKNDYLRYLKIDPFGDFALIFAAIKHNLKVVEIPVRYKEREYGSTNIRRFHHGLMLARLAIVAWKEFKV